MEVDLSRPASGAFAGPSVTFSRPGSWSGFSRGRGRRAFNGPRWHQHRRQDQRRREFGEVGATTELIGLPDEVLVPHEGVTVRDLGAQLGAGGADRVLLELAMLDVKASVGTKLPADLAQRACERMGVEVLVDDPLASGQDALLPPRREANEAEAEAVLEASARAARRLRGKATAAVAGPGAPTLVARPPIVTVLGHVDHGKTTLLDHILHTSVASREAGGITQRIGATECVLGAGVGGGAGGGGSKGKKAGGGRRAKAVAAAAAEPAATTPLGRLTFLDTPGHEAFAAMRARGARVTDVAVLVVAADDGVRPQTVEAIAHAKDAGVPVAVALNKCDLPGANPEAVRSQLATQGLVAEAWGGDVPMVEISAKTGEGIDDLLEAVLLLAEMEELRARGAGPAAGAVLESGLDRQRGPTATLLVQEGQLRVGDVMRVGATYGHVRSMRSSAGPEKLAGPGRAVLVTGLKGVPEAGETFEAVVEGEREARRRAEEVAERHAAEEPAAVNLGEGGAALCLVLRAGTSGGLAALRAALAQLPQERVRLRELRAFPGDVTRADVELARASGAALVAFGCRKPPADVRDLASANPPVAILEDQVVYRLVESVGEAMREAAPDITVRVTVAELEVLALFGKPDPVIAGCRVTEGTIRVGDRIRVLRQGKLLEETRVTSLHRLKDEVRKVEVGKECGLSADGYWGWLSGDRIQAFRISTRKGFLTKADEDASGVELVSRGAADGGGMVGGSGDDPGGLP